MNQHTNDDATEPAVRLDEIDALLGQGLDRDSTARTITGASACRAPDSAPSP